MAYININKLNALNLNENIKPRDVINELCLKVQPIFVNYGFKRIFKIIFG